MIKALTDDEIKRLAEDIYRNRVFTSNHINPNDMSLIQTIFMPLAFMDEKTLEELMKDELGMFYEHMAQAGGRAINGYPAFTSFHFVNKEDTKKVWEMVENMRKAVQQI